MSHLLRIDSSSRLQDSHSRLLADAVVAAWQARHPQGTVSVRDLAVAQPPHISQPTIAGFYSSPEQRNEELHAALALSDTLIGEVQTADSLLFSVPVYNFSIPSALKAWIDHVVRIGETFVVTDSGALQGRLQGKRAYVVIAYGAPGYADGAMQAMDFAKPYLRALLGFLGIDDVHFFTVEGTTLDPERARQTRERALTDIAQYVN